VLESIGSWGYQVGAVGIILLTVFYLVAVPWKTDILGRLIAGVLGSLSSVLIIIAARQLGWDPPGGLLVWRAIVFCVFGAAVWTALGTFIWAQFWAPRVQRNRVTTRKERNEV
jgi:hypothetical protein